MGNFICTQCGLEYMGAVDIPPVELKCTICGNQNFSFELDEKHYEKIETKKMKIYKIIAAFLTFLSIYTAVACAHQLTHYFDALTSPEPNLTIAETKFTSVLILLVHLIQMLSFFGLFYYSFSILIGTKLNYISKNWMKFGIFTTSLYLIELIVWSLPLKLVEGHESTTTFIGTFFEVLFSSEILYHNIFQLLAYLTFFGLFFSMKQHN